MSITTGTITSQASWTLECTALRPILESITGIALISDTGADNSRILLYSVPGTNKYLKFLYNVSGYGRCDVLKIDNSTQLIAGITRLYYGYDQNYTIVVNGNLTAFMLITPLQPIYPAHFMWSSAGTISRFYIGTTCYIIHKTADTYCSQVLYASAGYQISLISKKTVDGEQLLYPVVSLADTTTYLDKAPLDNVYIFPNMDTLALYTQITINSVIYILLWPGILIKTA